MTAAVCSSRKFSQCWGLERRTSSDDVTKSPLYYWARPC